MPPLSCMCLAALPNRLPPSLLLNAQSVSWHVCIFHYFQFNTKPQRKEELAVGEESRREGEQDERREKSGRTKNKPPPAPFTPTLNPTLSQKEREKSLDPCWNCQYHSSVLLCKFRCVRVNGCRVNRGSCGTQALLTATSFV